MAGRLIERIDAWITQAKTRRHTIDLQEASADILNGNRPVLDTDRNWSMELYESQPTAALESASIAFVANIVENCAFGTIGTYVGGNHDLMELSDEGRDRQSHTGIVYRGATSHELKSRSEKRLRRIFKAAAGLGFGKVTQDGGFQSGSDPNGLFVFDPIPKVKWRFKSSPPPKPRHEAIREFTFKWGYRFDQEQVIVNDVADKHRRIYSYEWGFDDDGTRLLPEQSPVIDQTHTWQGVERFTKGHSGWTRTKRQFQKDAGWRLLWGFLTNKYVFKNYISSKSTHAAGLGDSKRGWKVHNLQERTGRTGWRIRSMGDLEALITGVAGPTTYGVTFPLAVQLAEDTNWPVVVEPRDGLPLPEHCQNSWDDPFLGWNILGERIGHGTYIIEPQSWESVFDFWEAREDRYGNR